MKRILAITRSYFKLGWKNLPIPIIPIAWLFSPLCIIFGYFFLEDYMMGIKESDYR